MFEEELVHVLKRFHDFVIEICSLDEFDIGVQVGFEALEQFEYLIGVLL